MSKFNRKEFLILASWILLTACQISVRRSSQTIMTGAMPDNFLVDDSKQDVEALSKAVSENFQITVPDLEYAEIRLTTPSSVPVETFESSDARLHMNALISSETAEKHKSFLAQIKISSKRGVLSVNANPSFYFCSIVRQNARLKKIRGTCLEKITIALPKLNRTRVYLNDHAL